MDWTQPIDAYCERLGPEFWAEPWNAVTNAAFLIAALVAFVAARRRGGPDAGIALLIAVLCAIGVGSFLFHTFANRWSVMADVIPIQIFILVYFALAMRRFAGMAWWGAILATALFAVLSAAGSSALPGVVDLNGSEGYVPPLLGLLVVGLALWGAGRRDAGRALVTGAAIFAVSLTFRTLDRDVCGAAPLGTHFMWHVLNAVLLGHLIVALIRYGGVRTAAADRTA
ncbi:ceramidase domain-containing protein [Acuticoccus sediminis]|uniref:ceramidase domain-containing protein n=1 Tax=Acuticoccus sediminis TaxID=2184697 RepID=UPI001CFE2C48|nr:ceramidase domain-containing protein [Acuticoccus sediminis]